MKFRVISPGRLHMSLLDMNGSLGRIDGGFGLSIQEPNVIVEFSDEDTNNHNNSRSSSTKSSDNGDNGTILEIKGKKMFKPLVKDVISKFSEYFDVSFPFLSIEVIKSIPAHVGLGSKTQFLLAIARGLCHLKRSEVDYDIFELTKLIERGGTSGIGYMAFDRGKFIIDLGHSFGPNGQKKTFLPSSASKTEPALPFIQLETPAEWKVLLIRLDVKQGANNTEEINIFQDKCPVDLGDVEKISHLILMKLIPGILTGNLAGFGDAIHEINNKGFKKKEIELQDNHIQDLIQNIYKKFHIPCGMSSFGPIIYAITENEAQTEGIFDYVSQTADKDPDFPSYTIYKTKPNNEGHKIIEL
ncbi:MAG TPA: beta-ribofuranosylaminobenzene 5'-phosphate synthase family protein [Patescibacteria group bacterium]|nr:beta-ribofuranosylaminobenzene 5'-phosphate synthase family protein [Patescibacteria group bacterium]